MKKLRLIAFLCSALAIMATSCNKDEEDPPPPVGGKSSAKQITSFVISGTPAVTATINEAAKTITAVMPEGTNLTALVPILTVSDKATVIPVSGTIVNFTTPVPFIVTAEDGSKTTYMATITAGTATGDPETLKGTMSANRILKDLGLPVDYIIDGMLYLDGNALLTIEQGVKILFTGIDGGIRVGENAGLKMVGTADKPIVFSGPVNNPNKGSWNHITYTSTRADNQMEYVQLLNGGATDHSDHAVLNLNGAIVSIKNCIIDGSLGNGVAIWGNSGMASAFENNTIKNCNIVPVWVDMLEKVRNFSGNNTFVSNPDNVIQIENSTSMKTNMTLKRSSIPYFLKAGINLDKHLTIEPGTSVWVNGAENIMVQEAGRLIAEGTAAAPIIIRGYLDEAGYWNGIRIYGGSSNNKLNYCQVSGGGKEDGWGANSNLYIWKGARIEIKNTSFSKSRYYGVSLGSATDEYFVTHSNVSFSECEAGNVWVEYTEDVLTELP